MLMVNPPRQQGLKRGPSDGAPERGGKPAVTRLVQCLLLRWVLVGFSQGKAHNEKRCRKEPRTNRLQPNQANLCSANSVHGAYCKPENSTQVW